jgi:TPR repeat protein
MFSFPSRHFKALLNAMIFGLLLTQQAMAEGRWAFVLGVADYADESVPDLDNTVNDARTMAASLNDMGFQIYYLENATRDEIETTAARIEAEQAGADLGLFYFAGHGLQLDGVNYALPADLKPEGDDFLARQGVSIQELVARLGQIGTASLVVILDSCRNSPFPDRTASGVGLALVDAPENTIIAYSTEPGAVALDGSGANSPYTAALASALLGPEQDIRDVLRLVRAKVRLATGGAQTPWYVDNSRGAITIHPREPVQFDMALLGGNPEEVTLATTAWRNIEQSADPRDFATFAELFPDTPQAEAASRQLVLMNGGQEPPFPLMEVSLPDIEPAVPDGLLSMVTECDILATGVSDVLGLVPAVPHDLVNTRAALRACVAAVAADPGSARLVGHLGRVLRLENRFEEALYYAEQATVLGNPMAWGSISEIYRLGLGVPADPVRAAEAARLGAMTGAPGMRLLMGMHYREGWGVPQSFSEARRWMEIAALSNSPAALTALGDLYRRGQGMPADPERAMPFYIRAAALGHTDAMNLIGMAYMRGQGVEQDTEEGIRWLTEATDLGNPYAAFHLGRAFLTGWGVQPDQRTALAYFRLSAQRNYLGAYAFLGDILTSADAGDLRDVPEGYANYIIARDAAILRDTIDSKKELVEIEAKIATLLGTMSESDRAAGEKIAQEWIAQYGLLDFNLVHE